MTIYTRTEKGTALTRLEVDANWLELRALTDSRINIKSPTYNATGDGTTDDASAFQAAVTAQIPIFLPPGTYKIGSTVRVPTTGFLDITAIPGTVTIICPKDVIPFGKASGATTSVSRILLDGIIFDGDHARGTTWPYSTATSNYGMLIAFSITANPNTDDTEVLIRNCVFKDFQSYPFQVWHFKRVEFSRNKISRCKDPGFLFCQNVVAVENVVEWSSDNGFSVSRGCKNIICCNNVIKDSEIAGIWVAGYTPSTITSSTITITGTYTAGGAVTLTSNNASQWNYQYLNTYVAVTKGSDVAVVKITAISSFTVATGIAVAAVPAGLQNAASDSWVHAPGTGPAAITVTGNTIVGADTGVRGTAAARHCNVSGNTILRSGYVADSEVYSLGSIITGTNSLVVADGSKFAQNDWVIIDPPNSLDDYFIAKVSSKASNTLTLDRNAPVTYSNEPVRLCHQLSGSGAGIWFTGDVRAGVHQFTENLKISANLIVDYYISGVSLGSLTTGSPRRVSINGNDFWQPGLLGSASTRGVIRVNEYTGKAAAYITARENNTDDSSQFFRAFVRGTAARTFQVKNNYAPNVSAVIKVYDADNGDADITASNDYTV